MAQDTPGGFSIWAGSGGPQYFQPSEPALLFSQSCWHAFRHNALHLPLKSANGSIIPPCSGAGSESHCSFEEFASS